MLRTLLPLQSWLERNPIHTKKYWGELWVDIKEWVRWSRIPLFPYLRARARVCVCVCVCVHTHAHIMRTRMRALSRTPSTVHCARARTIVYVIVRVCVRAHA